MNSAAPAEPPTARHYCSKSAFAHEPREGCSEFTTPVDPPAWDPMTMSWFAQPNDLIGGWCVMPVPKPPSCGVPEVADFCRQEVAEHVAELHNAWLVHGPVVVAVAAARKTATTMPELTADELTLNTIRDWAESAQTVPAVSEHARGYELAVRDVQLILDMHGTPPGEPVIFPPPCLGCRYAGCDGCDGTGPR